MVVSSIYMMIDGIFVGRYIGSHALAAVNLAFPVIMILFAVGDMVARGYGGGRLLCQNRPFIGPRKK